MSLESALHTWISNSTAAEMVALRAVLPAASIVTGWVQDNTHSLPYACLNRESTRTNVRTNAGQRLDAASIRFQIWHNDHAAGLVIVNKLLAALDNGSYTGTAARILAIRVDNEMAFQEEDGVWQFVVDFNTLYYEGT